MTLAGWKIRLLVGWTGLATGTCFLLFAIGFAVYEGYFLSHSTATEGTVLANIEVQQPDASTGAFCTQFQYESADGTTHTMTSSACADPPAFAVGQRIRIHYANSNPADAQTDSFGAKWGMVLGFGIATLLLLPLGALFLSRTRKEGHSLDLIGFWD